MVGYIDEHSCHRSQAKMTHRPDREAQVSVEFHHHEVGRVPLPSHENRAVVIYGQGVDAINPVGTVLLTTIEVVQRTFSVRTETLGDVSARARSTMLGWTDYLGGTISAYQRQACESTCDKSVSVPEVKKRSIVREREAVGP